MAESGRKRCRKDKLVPRDCPAFFDDDSVLQTPPQKRLLLDKIKKEPEDFLLSQEASALEFSIKVEVEDVDDTLPDEDPSDYMQYLFSLSKESTSEPCLSSNLEKHMDEEKSFVLDVNKIYKLLPTLPRKYPNDKEAAIFTRNAWGKVFFEKNEELPTTPQENQLQETIAEWRTWNLVSSKTRESPFCYKCYICSHAWWHYIDFRDHVRIHPGSNLKLELIHQECNIVCFETAEQPSPREIYVDGKCTKCAKTYNEHLQNKMLYYHCIHCTEKFTTCAALNRHVGLCDRNPVRNSAVIKDIMNSESNFTEYVCKVCDVVFLSKLEQIEHLNVCHRVRSDEPVANNMKICRYCYKPYYFFAFHICTKRNINHACKFCQSKFQSRQMVEVHNRMWKNKTQCRICNKILIKECMAPEHYASHSDNFQMLYRCLTCKKMKVFQCADTARIHHSKHRRFDSRRPGWDKIIVPKIMLEQCLFKTRHTQQKKRTPSVKSSIKMPLDTVKKRIDSQYSNETQKQYKPRIRNVTIDETKSKTNEIASNDKIPEDANLEKSKKDSSVLEQITESIDIKPDIVKVKEEVCDEEDSKTDLITYTFEEPVPSTDSQTDLHTETEASKVFQPTEDLNQVAKVFQVSQSLLEPETILIKQEIKEEPLDDDDLILINESNESVKQESVDSDSSGLSLNKLEPEVILKAGYRKRKVYRCAKCEYEGYHREYKEHVNNMCMKVAKPKSVPTDFNFKCTKCNHCYANLKGYIHHFVEHNYKYLSCPQCGAVFDSISKLMPHVSGHIKNQFVRIQLINEDTVVAHKKAFQCKSCKEIIGNVELFVHWEKHLEISAEAQKETEVVKMPERTEYALEPQALRRILDLLEKPPSRDGFTRKVKQCFVCQRKFERQNDAKRHLIEHLLEDAYASVASNRNLKCQICKELFKKPDEYKKHMRDHASLPVYQCAMCNKTFSDSSNFTKHKKIHNLKAFVCDICSKKFQVKASLEKHIEMHLVTQPIQCDRCDRVFHDRSFYNRHKRQFHDKTNKSTKCIICRIRFGTLREKWDHLWEVHKLRKEKADCPICNKEYRKFVDVKKHCQDEHCLTITMDDILKVMEQYNIKNEEGKTLELNYISKNEWNMMNDGDDDSGDDLLLIEEERETLVIFDDDAPT